MYQYQFDGKAYEKYRDGNMLFEIKRHSVKSYYAHFHYAVEICFVLKGSFEYSINGKKGRADEGELVFINPGEMHEYFENNDCELYVVIMSELYSADYIAEFGPVHFDNRLGNLAVNAKLKELFDECFENRGTNCFFENKIFVNRMYSLLYRNYTATEKTGRELFLNKLLEYIYTNYKENITVEKLAKEFSYSAVTIAKLFQQEIKVDFRVFINNIRADMVHKMLKDVKYKDWSLAQIVMECGFVSLATFYRSYKRRFGCTPEKKHC